MKKLIATILIVMMSPISVLAQTAGEIGDKVAMSDRIALYNKRAPIEDELINSKEFPQIMPVYERDNSPITDELMDTFSTDGNTIKLKATKTGEYKKEAINDELITPRFRAASGTISVLKLKNKTVIEDSFAKNNIKLKDKIAVKAKNKYDFTKTQIPVQLKVIKNLTTRNNLAEGDSILFKTIKDIYINGVNLPKGTDIIGRVETISESDKMGTPANIIIDNFFVKDNPSICFYGNISKTGANRSLWVYPLYQAGNLVLYVAGFVFVPIHGGHAKLSTNETYTVFYETH